MISTNIKYARMANGMSLQELSEKISFLGFPTTKATLSNYENGKYIPSDDFLKILSQVLNTSKKFFLNENNLDYDLSFFTVPSMVDRKRQYLEAFISVELNRFGYIDKLLGISSEWKKPVPRHLKNPSWEEMEEIALQFRKDYGAGDYVLASVCGILERKGWHIFSLPDFCTKAMNISGYEYRTETPFILYQPDGYQDEMRIHLLKNVGYAYLEGDTPEETEKLAIRFAYAVLLPAKLAEYTYGKKRHALTDYELSIGKRLYGIGKRYIVSRLWELHIIPDSIYNEFNIFINQKHDLKRSSGLSDDPNFFDMPTTYEMRLARAQAEGLTSIQGSKSIFTGQDYV